MSRKYKSNNHGTVCIPVVHEVRFRDGKPTHGAEKLDKYDLETVCEIFESIPEGMDYGITLKDHYAALNILPAIPGTKWQITEEIYDYFLDMLPPMDYQAGFLMSEADHDTATGTVRSYYHKSGGHYWFEWVEIPHKQNGQMEKEHY